MRKIAVPLLILFLMGVIIYLLIIMLRTESVLGLKIGESKEQITREFEHLAIRKLEEGKQYILYERLPSTIKHIKSVKLSFSERQKLNKFEIWFAKRATEIVSEGIEDDLYYKKSGGGQPDFELYHYVRNKLTERYGEPNIESVSKEKGWAACKWHLKNVDVVFGINGDICGLSCYSSRAVKQKIRFRVPTR